MTQTGPHRPDRACQEARDPCQGPDPDERAGDLIELVYLSTASARLRPHDIADIVEGARRHNAGCGVTGLLVYDGARFLQVIEGARRDITRLYGRILSDPRHHDVVTVHEGALAARAFEGWSMAYRRLPEDTRVLALARRQLESGRTLAPVLSDVGRWIAGAMG